MLNMSFALFSNNNDELRHLYNYLNQKFKTTINTLKGSMLGDNLTMTHQVDYISSAFILAEAVENNQDCLVK